MQTEKIVSVDLQGLLTRVIVLKAAECYMLADAERVCVHKNWSLVRRDSMSSEHTTNTIVVDGQDRGMGNKYSTSPNGQRLAIQAVTVLRLLNPGTSSCRG